MLVIFDARAQSVPLWLSASGFVLWGGLQLAGAQYRIPYKYKVCGGLGCWAPVDRVETVCGRKGLAYTPCWEWSTCSFRNCRR